MRIRTTISGIDMRATERAIRDLVLRRVRERRSGMGQGGQGTGATAPPPRAALPIAPPRITPADPTATPSTDAAGAPPSRPATSA